MNKYLIKPYHGCDGTLVITAQAKIIHKVYNGGKRRCKVRRATTVEEVNAVVESVRQAFDGQSQRPQPEWVRGKCPKCGDDLVSNCYYIGGTGYVILWECWSSLGGAPLCNYRRNLMTGKDNMETKSE